MGRVSYLIIIIIVYLLYGGLTAKDNEDTNHSDEQHSDTGQVIKLTSTLIKEDFLADFYIKGVRLVKTNNTLRHQYYILWNGIYTDPLSVNIYSGDTVVLHVVVDNSIEYGIASIPVSTINSVNLNPPLIKVGIQ